MNISTCWLVQHLNALNIQWHDEIYESARQILIEIVQCILQILNEIVGIVFDSIVARLARIISAYEYGD